MERTPKKEKENQFPFDPFQPASRPDVREVSSGNEGCRPERNFVVGCG